MSHTQRSHSRKGETLARLLHQEGITNQQVLQAIASTPRELFLPDALRHKAYQNTALPIGQGQTISQPYIVARMTELLLDAPNQPKPFSKSALAPATKLRFWPSFLARSSV